MRPPGPMEIGLILVIILIVFGVGKLPQVGSALGKGIHAFKRGQAGDDEEGEEEPKPKKKTTKKRKAAKKAPASKKTSKAKEESAAEDEVESETEAKTEEA